MAPKKATATTTKASGPTAADFNVGDVVLTKIKGYPDWPSKVGFNDRAKRVLCAQLTCIHRVKVMDHDSAPAAVQKQKQNRSLLVRFFPDGD